MSLYAISNKNNGPRKKKNSWSRRSVALNRWSQKPGWASTRGSRNWVNQPHHRLNMEVDLQSLFGFHVTLCAQLYSLAETPQLPPLTPHLHLHLSMDSYTRALLDSKVRQHLFVTPWTTLSKLRKFRDSYVNFTYDRREGSARRRSEPVGLLPAPHLGLIPFPGLLPRKRVLQTSEAV